MEDVIAILKKKIPAFKFAAFSFKISNNLYDDLNLMCDTLVFNEEILSETKPAELSEDDKRDLDTDNLINTLNEHKVEILNKEIENNNIKIHDLKNYEITGLIYVVCYGPNEDEGVFEDIEDSDGRSHNFSIDSSFSGIASSFLLTEHICNSVQVD